MEEVVAVPAVPQDREEEGKRWWWRRLLGEAQEGLRCRMLYTEYMNIWSNAATKPDKPEKRAISVENRPTSVVSDDWERNRSSYTYV